MRWSRLFDIPMAEEMPPGFPWNTVQVQRALVAALQLQPDLVPSVIDLLYGIAWSEGKDVSSSSVHAPAFVKVFGESRAKDIFEMVRRSYDSDSLPYLSNIQAKNEDVKQALLKNGERALESGCFGLPWFIGEIGCHLFVGVF